MIAAIAGGTSTWDTSSEKFSMPSRFAWYTVIALAGAVVSNPMPKNTTCLSGLSRAIVSASSGEYTTRTSPPWLLTWNRSFSLPGTRSMSPNEQKITSGRDAISSALSMISSGVTQTGQPGPWIISIVSGSNWSMPCRMIECVWPPQTSMIAQRWLVVGLDLVDELAGQSGSLNSSRYFMTSPRNSIGLGDAAGFARPACLAASSNPSPNSSLSTPRCSNSASVAHRRLLVETLDRETHMDHHVFADLGVGYVLQADVLLDAAEVDDGHQRAVAVLDAENLPRYRQTHGRPPFLIREFPTNS